MEPPRFAAIRNGFGLWPWFVQLFGVWSMPIALGLFESSMLGLNETVVSPIGAIGIQIVNPNVIVALALSAGTVVSTKVRAKGAAWVWVLPCTVLVMAIIVDLRSFRSWHLIWVTYFYWDHPGADVGPLLRDLLTYPALSAIAYSTAAAVCKVRGHAAESTGRPANFIS